MKMTGNEHAILSLLQQEGEKTAIQLAYRLGISDSTARRNLTKLEMVGVVRRVVISDNPKTFGWSAVPPEPEYQEQVGNPAADDLDTLVDETFHQESPKFPDQEIDAMRIIHESLEPLDASARYRVLQWVCSRLNIRFSL